MVDQFFSSTLRNTDSRIAPVRHSGRYLLDKNEQSDDLDPVLKKKVLECLMETNWNRYPASDYRDIETRIAQYCGLDAQNIVLSAGSASIITTLLDYFALNKKKIAITQPSYSLFDYHCKTYNIPYTPWLLTPDLNFDLDHLPQLEPGSVLIITSPNNPTGNVIQANQLEQILISHPDSFIILDGVYCEFGEEDMTPLVKKYDNLIVLRSFSKAFPVAGLRLGYLCAAPATASIIRKLILQFSITPFSLIFAREILFSPKFLSQSRQKVRNIIRERVRIKNLIEKEFNESTIRIFPSQGNFLLIRIQDHHIFENLMADLMNSGIKVLNTSGFPLLQNSLRVSIGNRHENEIFLECLRRNIRPFVISNGQLGMSPHMN